MTRCTSTIYLAGLRCALARSNFIAFLAIVILSPLCDRSAAQSEDQDELSSTEQFVQDQVEHGKEADVSALPDSQLRSTFVEALLFKNAFPWNLEKTGIHIRGAKVVGTLNLANLEVIHELSLTRCEFTDDVIFTNTSFKKSLDLSQSIFGRQADLDRKSVV